MHLKKARRAPSIALAESIVVAYRLDDHQAVTLLAEAVDNTEKSSPYKR